MKYSIFINGSAIALNEVDSWELRRLGAVYRKLGITPPPAGMPIDLKARKLAEAKQALGYEEIFSKVKLSLQISAFFAKIMKAASFGKRKVSVTEFLIEGLSASKASCGIEKLMLESTPQHNLANLEACPDHYALRCLPDSRLEVIETTGGSPFPIRFFITYGDEDSLVTPRDQTYPFQSVGVARLHDGTVIGGIRHQFRDEENCFRARLAVEFPYATPEYFIRQHQIHLACEFRRWFQWLAIA